MKRELTTHIDVEQHVETHRRNVRRRITSENLVDNLAEGVRGEVRLLFALFQNLAN
jgi:hypothetical protein